jgi:hypothetical protein
METHCTEDAEIVQSPIMASTALAVPQPLSEDSPASESPWSPDSAVASLTTGFDAALVQPAVHQRDRGHSSTMEKPDSEETSESAERPTVSSGCSSLSTVDIAEEVKRMILPDILQAITQSRANDLSHPLDSLGINLQSPPSQALTQPVTHIMHPSRLRDLQRFLKDDSASFKHPQQALALELIRGKEPSLLVIGPTGTMIYIYIYLVALLIAPLRIWQDPPYFHEH